MADVLSRTLRIDARENRDRVLDAARELFAERGIEVTMRDIARRAEVGPATLYRRFPTKRALMDDAFASEMHECRAIVVECSADPDPWRGFASVIERITELNVRNNGFVDAFLSANPEFERIATHRASLFRMLTDLAGRARRAGGLRGAGRAALDARPRSGADGVHGAGQLLARPTGERGLSRRRLPVQSAITLAPFPVRAGNPRTERLSETDRTGLPSGYPTAEIRLRSASGV